MGSQLELTDSNFNWHSGSDIMLLKANALLRHAMSLRPFLSNALMIIRRYSDRSCSMMPSECKSARHHSLVSSIHSLLSLPLLFCPPLFPTPHHSPTGCHPTCVSSSIAFHFKCHRRVYVSLPQEPGLTCIWPISTLISLRL